MERIDRDDVLRITQQMERIARPLDWARWQAWRGHATWSDVVPHLAAFQNADGGFGHGIEPDVWHPASSPLATTIGVQYALSIGLPMHHAVVQQAMTYLVGAYDAAGKWHPMTTGVHDYPHAPWWHPDPQIGTNALDNDWPNPTVEIIGYLSSSHGVEVDMTDVHETLVRHICHAEAMEPHALACYVRAYPWLPEEVQVCVYPHVVRLLHGTIHPNPTDWLRVYVPTPLDYVQTPLSPFFAECAALVDIQLSQWRDHVRHVGLWTPTWEWGTYGDEWPTAQAWWTGKLTVERMMLLDRFGMIVP